MAQESESPQAIERRRAPHELVNHFLLTRPLADQTRRTYRCGLEAFLLFLEQKKIERPSPQDLAAFRESLVSSGLSPLSVNTYLYAVRSFFKFLARGRLYPDIGTEIKGLPRATGHARRSLDADELRRLFQSIDRSSLSGLRDYAMLNLMARTGLRSVEAVHLDLGDLGGRSGRKVLYVRGKGRPAKSEYVVLTEKSWRPLDEYLQARTQAGEKLSRSSPLFVSHGNRSRLQRLTTRALRKIAAARFRAAGLDTSRLSPHSLRHTAAHLALYAGSDIRDLKEMLRHKSLETTMVYLREVDRLSRAPEDKIDF